MSTIENWSVTLARDTAPDEIDLAPIMGNAYAAGGKTRKQIFGRTGSALGGFAPGATVMVMPLLLRSIASARAELIPALTALAAAPVGSLTSSGGDIPLLDELALPAPQERSSAVTSAATIPDVYQRLRTAAALIRAELLAGGIREEDARRITLGALRAFMAQPQSAAEFLTQLTERT